MDFFAMIELQGNKSKLVQYFLIWLKEKTSIKYF